MSIDQIVTISSMASGGSKSMVYFVVGNIALQVFMYAIGFLYTI